jgi:hypothetical protein
MNRFWFGATAIALIAFGILTQGDDGPRQARAQYIGSLNAIQCNKIASVAPSSATTTSVVAGVAGTSIHICGYQITSSVASGSTAQLEYGTQGGPCTTPTTISGALNLSTTSIINRSQYAFTSIPAGSQVCVVTTGGSVGVTYDLYYATSTP